MGRGARAQQPSLLLPTCVQTAPFWAGGGLQDIRAHGCLVAALFPARWSLESNGMGRAAPRAGSVIIATSSGPRRRSSAESNQFR